MSPAGFPRAAPLLPAIALASGAAIVAGLIEAVAGGIVTGFVTGLLAESPRQVAEQAADLRSVAAGNIVLLTPKMYVNGVDRDVIPRRSRIRDGRDW